jgi:hypothetical protein
MISEEDRFFTYDALNLLDKDMDNILSSIKINEVILVPFKVNFNCSKPFNTFLLTKTFMDDLNFSYINLMHIDNSSELFLSTIHCYLYSLFSSNNELDLFKYDFETFINVIDFKGLYIHDNKTYAFIDLTKVDINIGLVSKDSLYWFALLDEIVNTKQICNIEINDDVSDFFMMNNDFIYFKNSKCEQIEIPTAVYTGTHEKNLQFRFIFGNISRDSNSILSEGFYFTNYNNAFREGGWSIDYTDEFKYGKKITEDDENNVNGKYIKGGILRYALFLGNNLVKQNLPNDDIDNSEIKKDKVNTTENANNNIYEKMTLRISDHDGVWKQHYDSVYLGKIELDDGTYLKNSPMYVIKDYYNHTPLSYHNINKKTLGYKFDENSDYCIM